MRQRKDQENKAAAVVGFYFVVGSIATREEFQVRSKLGTVHPSGRRFVAISVAPSTKPWKTQLPDQKLLEKHPHHAKELPWKHEHPKKDLQTNCEHSMKELQPSHQRALVKEQELAPQALLLSNDMQHDLFDS